MSTVGGGINGRHVLVCASGLALLMMLGGCRGGESSTRHAEAEVKSEPAVTPEEDAAKSEPAATPEEDAAKSEPAVTPEEDAAKSEPPDPAATEEELSDTYVRVAGRSVKVRLDEQERPPEPTEDTDEGYPSQQISLVVSIDGATSGDGLLTFPTTFDYCDVTEAVVEPVAGEPSPLVLAQAFCEMGEDEFSREILAAVIHVGDAATPPRVLWQGTGSYSNSFGVCEDIDVPSAKVTTPGTVVVKRFTIVAKHRDPDRLATDCKPRKKRVRTLAEIAY